LTIESGTTTFSVGGDTKNKEDGNLAARIRVPLT
jgi:hypothetical protein